MKKYIMVIAAIIIGSLVYFYFNDKNKITTTNEGCFEFENNTIISYNPICGPNVIIPLKINNEEVFNIGNYAFKGLNLENITFNNNLKSIGIGSFMDNKLKYVSVPDSVFEIKALAFNNNEIRSLYIGNNVSEIGIKAFNNNDLKIKYAFIYKRTNNGIDKTNIIGYGGRDKNIKIPDGVTTISSYAFNDSKIESITFNKELKRIEEYALSGNNISELTILSNINYIQDNNLTDKSIRLIKILGKNELSEFDYFDNEFTKKGLIVFGDSNE